MINIYPSNNIPTLLLLEVCFTGPKPGTSNWPGASGSPLVLSPVTSITSQDTKANIIIAPTQFSVASGYGASG